MSAYADNIIENLKKTDPVFANFIEFVIATIERGYESIGLAPPPNLRSGIIVKTEEMTKEEVEMQCIEYFLRQGMPLKEAEKETHEYLKKTEDAFDQLDAPVEAKKERLQ